MGWLSSTIALYRSALLETGRSTRRTILAVPVLVAAFIAIQLVAGLVAPLGLVGGFIVGFMHAGAVGWYLSLIEVGVTGRRKVKLEDIRASIGLYFWEVISVGFIFWIGQMVIQGLTSAAVLAAAVLLASIIFNPAPELIYQGRTRGLDLLGDAMRFMQNNWPEWLGAHLGAAAVMTGWLWLSTGAIDIGGGTELVRMFGPFFGFLGASGVAFALISAGAIGAISAVAFLLFTHAFMLFRGHLYRELSTSSRRSRQWRARMG